MARSAPKERLWSGVKLIISAEKDDKGRIKGLGTGFVCGRKGNTVYLLTCWHVVKDIRKDNLRVWHVVKDTGETNLRVEEYKPEVVAEGDKALDLALLAVDNWPDSEVEVLALSRDEGRPDQEFLTIGLYWANEKEQDVPNSRPLEGQLGQQNRKWSDRYGYVAGWEFSVTQNKASDKLRPGHSGAPVFDPASGLVVAVISHQEGDTDGHAIDVSNLKTLYPPAKDFFVDSPSDEGYGPDHWIVKTLDHQQVAQLRAKLNSSANPVVAIVEGCLEDWPKYLADDVFLYPWPAFDEMPQEATTLRLFPSSEGTDFWSALHNQRVPAPQRAAEFDREREREAVRAWLRNRDRHLFFVSCGMETHRGSLRQLIRDGQRFLAELARCEPSLRLLMVIVCQPCQDNPPWWWPFWRQLLKRLPSVLWLEPLRPLQRPDLDDWLNGFTPDVLRCLSRDQLRKELLKLFGEKRVAVRYDLIREYLLQKIRSDLAQKG